MVQPLKKIAKGVSAAAAILGFLSSPTIAQETGDRHSGYNFAQKHCAECHAVEPSDLDSPNPSAPSFTSVAKTSGMNGRALAAWLDTSHPTMPNFILRRDDRDDVVAYIISLKNAPVRK